MKKKLFLLFVLSFMLSIISPLVFPKLNVENVTAATVGKPELISAKNVSAGIAVTWKALEEADGYRVFRKNPGKNWAAVKTLAGTENCSYTDTSVSDGITYIYTVRAYKREGGNILWGSYDVTGVSATMPPAAPKLISAKGSGVNKIALRWNAVSGVNGYRIYRKEYGTSKWNAIRTITSGITGSYIDGTVKMGVRYCYTVRAYKRVAGKVVWGKYDAKGLLANSVVAAPKLVSATASADGSVVLKWKQSGTVNGYNVYRKVSGGKWVMIKKGNTATSYKDTSCTPGETYYYTVRSFVTTNGSSVYSSYNSAGLKVTAIVPAPLRASAKWSGKSSTGANIQITWKAQKLVDGYFVYRREYSGGTWQKWNLIGRSNGADNSVYADQTAVWNAKYRYTVRAFKNHNGKTLLSAYDTVGAEVDVKIPATKHVSIVENDIKDVTVSWEPVDGADGYRVYKIDSEYNEWSLAKVLNGQNATSYNDRTCDENITYTYAVRAFVKYNNKYILGLYDGTSYKIKTKVYYPGTPVLVSATAIDSTHMRLKWEPEKYATGYVIYRKKPGDAEWTQRRMIMSSTTGFQEGTGTDFDLEEEQTYYFAVSSLKSIPKFGIKYESPYGEETIMGTTMRGVLELSSEELVMAVDESVAIKLKGTSRPVQWSSSDPSIATVEDGTIKALKAGNADIVAEFEGEQYVCKVTVEQPVISSQNVELTLGGSKNLTVMGTAQNVRWSYDSSYVTLESIGINEVKVTPVKAGTTTVTAIVEMNDRQLSLNCIFAVSGFIKSETTEITVKTEETISIPIQSNYFRLYASSADSSLVSCSIEKTEGDEFLLKLSGKEAGTTTLRVYSEEPVAEILIDIIVEKDNTIEMSNQKLKEYIWKKGQIIDSTFRVVSYSEEKEGVTYCWSIGYESTSDFFSYSMSMTPALEEAENDVLVVGVSANAAQTKRAFVSASWMNESQGQSCEMEYTVWCDTYNKNSFIIFNVPESNGVSPATMDLVMQAANGALKKAFNGWETIFLEKEVGITLKDLGFKAYM